MTGNISFPHYQTANRTPGVFADIDPSHANTGTLTQVSLIIGQITAAGTGVVGVPVISQGVADARSIGGPGSMLALMTAQYRASDSFGELWYLPLADDPTAVAATGSITYTAAPTATGVHSLYIAGVLVSVPVTASMTAANMATAVAAATTAMPDLPVTAMVDGVIATKVDITAKNKGLCGNDIDIRTNYLGSAGGQSDPAGLTYTITAMSGGLVNPTGLAAALANLTTQTFDFIALPYTDTASLNAVQTFLNDATGRWSWQQQLYGHAFAAARGTFAALTTLGVARNDQHVSVIGYYDSPTPSWLWAADFCANCASSLRNDPALPLQTLALGVLAPPVASRFPLTERNTLLYDGISTFKVDTDGTVRIERAITTYQMSPTGVPDNSYLDVETMFTLMFVCRDLETYLSTTFARMKLVSDTTPIPPGSNTVNGPLIKAFLIARYAVLQTAGYVQNLDAFAQSVQVQNAGGGLVKVLWPGDLANQLRQLAILVQFQKT